MARALFEAQSHECAKRVRILEVELQLAVAQAVNLFQQCNPQHLIAAQPLTPPIAPPPLQEILLDELCDLRMRVENPGSHL